MKSFTDIKGRAWEIVVTVATVKRVRALCKVDLNSIVGSVSLSPRSSWPMPSDAFSSLWLSELDSL